VATAETWHLKGHVLLVNEVDFPVLLFIFTYKELCCECSAFEELHFFFQ
jgi:hypothetical protein